jgi:Secretion system C-terminal sorting domain
MQIFTQYNFVGNDSHFVEKKLLTVLVCATLCLETLIMNTADKAMRTFTCILVFILFATASFCQGNHVFSGGEAANFSIVDIPASGTATWSTDRTSTPGYFSIINTAAYTGCSDAANINGYIKKYGNNPFIFPVGSGNDLRTLEISSPLLTTDAYATAWIAGNPSNNLDHTAPNAGTHDVFAVAAPIIAVSTAGQWDWQVGEAGNLGSGTTGNGAGLTITVSIPDMTSFAVASSLRLVGWNGTNWIDLSGTATATGNTENSLLSGTMVPGITAVAIGTVSWVLPLKLESFTANASNCDAVISWVSSNEINTDKFIVEQSTDNIHYTPAVNVKAKGNSNTVNNYSVTLAQPTGLVYYRLKMIDINGTYTYSNVIVCRTHCAVNEFMRVYPNPVVATGTVNLSFGTAYKGRATLIITNTLGQRFTAMAAQVNTGTNLIPVEVARFAAGTYFITLLAENGEQIGTVQKFIKQ